MSNIKNINYSDSDAKPIINLNIGMFRTEEEFKMIVDALGFDKMINKVSIETNRAAGTTTDLEKEKEEKERIEKLTKLLDEE